MSCPTRRLASPPCPLYHQAPPSLPASRTAETETPPPVIPLQSIPRRRLILGPPLPFLSYPRCFKVGRQSLVSLPWLVQQPERRGMPLEQTFKTRVSEVHFALPVPLRGTSSKRLCTARPRTTPSHRTFPPGLRQDILPYSSLPKPRKNEGGRGTSTPTRRSLFLKGLSQVDSSFRGVSTARPFPNMIYRNHL